MSGVRRPEFGRCRQVMVGVTAWRCADKILTDMNSNTHCFIIDPAVIANHQFYAASGKRTFPSPSAVPQQSVRAVAVAISTSVAGFPVAQSRGPPVFEKILG